MNAPVSVLVGAAGLMLVWAGITDPPGGLVGTVGRVLRGEAQPTKATHPAATTDGVLSLVPAFLSGTPSAGGGSGSTLTAGLATTRTYPGLGAVKPHVKRAAEIVGSKFAVTSILGWGLRDNASDHPLGLGLDFMVNTDSAKGQQVASFMQANATALGVTYLIWEQRIWSVARASEGWRKMPDRGGRTANHFDHVHASFQVSAPATATQGIAA